MLTKIQSLLLDCLKFSSESIPPDRFSTLTSENWKDFLALAADQRVRSILYHRIKQQKIISLFPENIIQNLSQANKNTTTLNLFLISELNEIAKTLKENNITLIVLKGLYLASQVYENISLREMNDIDLLVKKEEIFESLRILDDLGYKPTSPISISVDELTRRHLPPFYKLNIGRVELHWTIADLVENYSVNMRDLWERSIPIEIYGIQTMGLSHEDLLLHVCLHTSYQHLFSFGLRPSMDINQLVSSFGNNLDWDRLIRTAKDWNIQRGVYLSLRLAKELLGTEIQDKMLLELEPQSFDETYLNMAINQTFTDKYFAQSASSNPIGIKIVEETNWWLKLKLFLNFLFLPKETLGNRYFVSSTSLKIYWYYLVHINDTLRRHFGKVRQLLKRQSPITKMAKRKLALVDWLSEED